MSTSPRLNSSRNVAKMQTDGIPACTVIGGIGFDFDSAAAFGEREVIRGHLVLKRHGLTARNVYLPKVDVTDVNC